MSSKLLHVILLSSQLNFLLGDPIVELPNGLLNGQEEITLANKTYYAFRCVPYAAAPVGVLRFQAPQPVGNWEGTRDATTCTTTCFQVSSNNENESEDCLFINVFTPQLPSENTNVSLPVMLFIHGGAFNDGTGLEWLPDLFVNEDVVFAAINYRLGVFGFLSTQDTVIPGNNGLKDQKFAIQWVHDNIQLFGGDPNKFTIFGQSAGSASVAYQMLNQDSNGLFRNAILESGSFLSPFAYQRNARQYAFITASYLNNTFNSSTDSQALLDFLLTVPARDLDAAAQKLHDYEYGPNDLELSRGSYYAPTIEVRNPTAFVTRKMYGLLQAGNIILVPVLMGMTSEEILSFIPNQSFIEEAVAGYDEHLDWLVPDDMEIINDDDRIAMGEKIRDLYTGGEPFSDHVAEGIRFSSDTGFTRSIMKHAQLFSQVSDTYFYEFTHAGPMGGNTIHYDGAEDVGHAVELNYIFCGGTACDDSRFPEADRLTRQRFIKLWTNFAKYNNPTPVESELLQNITWPALDTDHDNFIYLDIGENLEIKDHPKWDTYKGWLELYGSLNFSDFDTY